MSANAITNGSGNPAQSGLGFTDSLAAGLTLSGAAIASQCGGTLSYDTSGSPTGCKENEHELAACWATAAGGSGPTPVSAPPPAPGPPGSPG